MERNVRENMEAVRANAEKASGTGRGRAQYAGLAVLGLVALGAILRLWRLDGQSAWTPEIVSAYVAALKPADIVSWLIADHKHYLDPPLYYFLLHSWFDVFGAGALQARLYSVLFGIASIPAAWLLARQLAGAKTSLLATLILTLSQTGVVYSQEARSHSQLVFFLVLTCYLFLRALAERRAWLWWTYVVSAILLFFSHPYGLFALAGLAVYAVARRRRYSLPWFWWAGGTILFLLPAALWIEEIAKRLPISTQLLFAASRLSMGTPVRWDNLAAAVGWLNGMKWSSLEAPASAWPFLVTGLLFTVPAVLGAWCLFQRRVDDVDYSEQRPLSLLLCGLSFLPLVAMVGLGTLGYNRYLDFENHIRYGVLCAVPYYILVATGLTSIRAAWLRRGAVVLLVASSAVSLYSVYYIPYKADYRQGVATIAKDYRAGDCVVFYPLINQMPLLGHRPGPPPYWEVYEHGRPDIRVGDVAEVVSGNSTCGRLWFLWDRTPWIDRDGDAQKAKQLLERTQTPIAEREFHLTELGLYGTRDHGQGIGQAGRQAPAPRPASPNLTPSKKSPES